MSHKAPLQWNMETPLQKENQKMNKNQFSLTNQNFYHLKKREFSVSNFKQNSFLKAKLKTELLKF